MSDTERRSPIGRRIHVLGNAASGKSTLAAHLARVLDAACVELDALNWEPGWVSVADVNPQELDRRIRAATRDGRWVVAGSYMSHARRTFWPRLDTVVWLDLPMWLLLRRTLRRTWQRWRSRELLWGTNYERFWPQLMIWRKDSLLTWIVTQHARKRRATLAGLSDPRWSHIRFVRLTSWREVQVFCGAVAAAVEGAVNISRLCDTAPASAERSRSAIGDRVQVMGNSGSGKTTFAARLARALDAELVDLDALNWEPGWVALNESDPVELERRFRAATGGERWVTAGSYTRLCQRTFWPRLETIVWLDLPLRLCVWRLIRRTWQRWRSRELLWGTNRERLWHKCKIWRKDNLLVWTVTQHARKRNAMLAYLSDPRWSHIRFVRLTSAREVEAFAGAAERLSSPSYRGQE